MASYITKTIIAAVVAASSNAIQISAGHHGNMQEAAAQSEIEKLI